MFPFSGFKLIEIPVFNLGINIKQYPVWLFTNIIFFPFSFFKIYKKLLPSLTDTRSKQKRNQPADLRSSLCSIAAGCGSKHVADLVYVLNL